MKEIKYKPTKLAKVTLGDTSEEETTTLRVALRVIATELKHRGEDVKELVKGVLE